MSQEWIQQSYLEVSRRDLAENARRIAAFLDRPVIAVVKCDGYGVSIPEAARAWRQAGVTRFGVSEPEEALALREAGFAQEEILLLTPVAERGILLRLLRADVILTVSGAACARFYAENRAGLPVRAHVAVDTGMGRFGTRWTDVDELETIYRTPGIGVEGIFSHCAASFEKDGTLTRRQLARFLDAVEALKKRGIDVGLRHFANSCAALRFPETRLDAVRIGSALVGRLNAPVPLELNRIGVFRAMVVCCRELKKGDTTGYASICRVKRDTRVAVVALGYQSGFGLQRRPESFRALELLRGLKRCARSYRERPYVTWRGKHLPVLGRIGTQFTLVEIGPDGPQPGDFVGAEVALLLPLPRRKYV